MILLCALAAATVPSSSKPMSGSWLLELCTSDNLAYGSYCDGFIGGFEQGLVVGNADTAGAVGIDVSNPFTLEKARRMVLGFCVPNGVTIKQKVDAVVQYLQANGGEQYREADKLIIEAFKEAFPCK